MGQVVDEVLKVGAWAEVKLLPGAGNEARQRLTLKIKDKDIVLPQYRAHPEHEDRLFIPRALVAKSGVPVEGYWQFLTAESKWRPDSREGQKETLDEFMSALDGNAPYGGILQAVTGAGKTVMALELACRIDLKTLIIVPRDSLVDQWISQIKKWTDAKDDDIGIVQGQRRIYKDKRFTVAMIHTLAQQHERYEKEFFKDFGTVIFDECHVVGAETFSLTAPLFSCKYRIGLSATPRRYDGMDSVFYWHIGPIIARFTKLQAKAKVRIIHYKGRDTWHKGCVYKKKLNLGRYLNRVSNSGQRRTLLARIVKKLDEGEHNILVLSDRIKLLTILKYDIEQLGVKSEDIGFLIGQRKDLSKRIILGTYGSAGMGVDIPRLSALVLATPRADIEQAVGRVLRQGTPIVVDVVDIASSIMQTWGAKRERFFKKITDDIKRST